MFFEKRASYDSSKAIISVINECAGDCGSDLSVVCYNSEREMYNKAYYQRSVRIYKCEDELSILD